MADAINPTVTKIGVPTTDKNASNIISLPLAFVRSGYIYLLDGYADAVGDYGYYRSHTVQSSTYAYRLLFNSESIGMNAAGRYHGFPLRWLPTSNTT